MTDKYGNDPHDHEGHDHDHMTGTEAEAWQGDQPPIDDFADHAGEEAATVSEETEAHDETHIAETAPKKSSMLLPIAVSVGGLLFLGAVLYWQFGVSHNAAPVEVASSTPAPVPAPTPVSAAPTPVSAAPTDIANLKPAEPDVAPTTGMGNPVMPAGTDVAQNPVAQTGSATPNGMPVQPAPVEQAPVAQPVPQPAVAAAIPPPTPTPTPVAAAPVAMADPTSSVPAISQSTEARLATLSAHVDDLQKSLAQATQQLSQISTMMAANPPGTSTGSNPAIEERLAKLEQKIGNSHHAAPDLISPSTAPETAMMPSTMSEPSTNVAKPSRHTHAARHTTRNTRTVTASHHSSTRHGGMAAAPATPSSSSSLVLRAAFPGEAWVAKDATTRELRPVHVGDQLPGIGRVQGIHQNGDAWVIEGTQGTLR